jgi:hypothetical protein
VQTKFVDANAMGTMCRIHLAFLALRVVLSGVKLEAGAAKTRPVALHLAALPLFAKRLCHRQ